MGLWWILILFIVGSGILAHSSTWLKFWGPILYHGLGSSWWMLGSSGFICYMVACQCGDPIPPCFCTHWSGFSWWLQVVFSCLNRCQVVQTLLQAGRTVLPVGWSLCGCMFVSSSWGRQYRMTDNPQWCSIHLKLWFRLAISVSMYKSQHVHYSLDLPPLRMYIELLRYIEGDQFGYKSTEISCLKSSNAPESVITPLGRPCSRPELYRTPSSWRRSGSPPRTGIWTGPQPVGVKWAVTKTGDDWG